MAPHSIGTTVRLLLLEAFWLEPDPYPSAREMSDRLSNVHQQWQAYLNALVVLDFEGWLKEYVLSNYQIQAPEVTVEPITSALEKGTSWKPGFDCAQPSIARGLSAAETHAHSQVVCYQTNSFSGIRTRLSQWLQGVLDNGWQPVDALINPEENLAWSTRHTLSGARGGKLINFGMQLGNQAVALLVTVTPRSEGKVGVNIQVLPVAGALVLPPQLKLTLLSDTDKILQEVHSREHDNYIQLKPFKGKAGTGFGIEVSLNHIRVREAFEL